MQSQQLLTQGKIFEDEILAEPECTNNPAEEMPEPPDHAKNFTGALPIGVGAKSLILWVYDVLMNDRACIWTAAYEVPDNGMATVGGDMAGDDRDDFRIGALGSHTKRAWKQFHKNA
jgi:hypothetical protein